MVKKPKMHSPNIVEENIAKITSAFPNCVTESKDDAGNAKKSIDFDLLRQELSSNLVEGQQERYQLNWPGKRQALLTANLPIAKTLRPCRKESVDFDSTKNLFIEGDNLDALKLLQNTYLGKVKMIYIDPPYNIGKDRIYKDRFVESTEDFLNKSCQVDDEGNNMVANLESNGRFHSDWLSMMLARLKIAIRLLREDGVIFISIDNNEVHNLTNICSEVFGEYNFISTLIWKSGRTAASHFTNEHEYILCFGKSKPMLPLFEFNGVETTSDRAIKRPTSKNPISRIKFPAGIDFESTDRIFPDQFGKAEPIKIVKGVFEAKNRKLANNVTIEAAWTMKDMIEEWLNGEDAYDQKDQKVTRFFFKANGVLQYEKMKGTEHPKSIIEGFTTKQGGTEIKDLLGANYFDFPKPKRLLCKLINAVTKPDDIVLDFFAGSSTTAHAVMQLNADDGGERKFIMVQFPERTYEIKDDTEVPGKRGSAGDAFKAGYKTIAEISQERIRRAGMKIKKESAKYNDMDIGFRVLKIDSSNMIDLYYNPGAFDQGMVKAAIENVKEERTSEDLLFQVMLDWGMDLSSSISIKKLKGIDVFLVAEKSLAACFVRNGKVTEDFCKELAKIQPERMIFLDSGFKDDSVKINVEQIFKLLSPHTELKTI